MAKWIPDDLRPEVKARGVLPNYIVHVRCDEGVWSFLAQYRFFGSEDGYAGGFATMDDAKAAAEKFAADNPTGVRYADLP